MKRKRKQTCYSSLSLLPMSRPGIVEQAGGTLCQWRRDTCWQSRQAERERARETDRENKGEVVEKRELNRE